MSYRNQSVENFEILLSIICLLFYLRDLYEGHLSLKDADGEQINLVLN